jgi:hypothetical protein
MSRKSAGLFLHTPDGISLLMNTKRGHALFQSSKQLFSGKKLELRLLYKSMEAEGNPWMFVAAARITVRWIIQH